MKALWKIFVNRLFQIVHVVFVNFVGRWEWFRQFRNVIYYNFWYDLGKSGCCVTSSVRSKSTFGADTSLFGSNLFLGSNSKQTCMGCHFHWVCGQEWFSYDQVGLRVSQSKWLDKRYHGRVLTVCDTMEQICVNLIVISCKKIVGHNYLFRESLSLANNPLLICRERRNHAHMISVKWLHVHGRHLLPQWVIRSQLPVSSDMVLDRVCAFASFSHKL